MSSSDIGQQSLFFFGGGGGEGRGWIFSVDVKHVPDKPNQ